MRWFNRFSIFVIIVLVLSACFSGWSWHQKLAVVVKTPNGEVSGSSVVRVGWSDVNSVGNYPSSYSGEATVVDVGNGKFLFALLGENTKFLAFRAFKGDAGIGAERFAEIEKTRGIKPVSEEFYPLLVTFEDINDPASVKEVDPDNLAATFGAGYSLESITLEITDEPVTEGKVEEVMGWLKSHQGRLKPTTKRYADQLTVAEQLYKDSFFRK